MTTPHPMQSASRECHKCSVPTTDTCPGCGEPICFMCSLPPADGYCNKRCAREHGQRGLFEDDLANQPD